MNWVSVLICIVLITLLVYIVYYGYRIVHESQTHVEKYESPSDEKIREKMSQIVLAFLRDNGYTDFEELKKFVQGQYDENLDDIYEDSTLTLYYSAFSKGSYTNEEDSKKWLNISPYMKKEKQNGQNMYVLPYDKSHILAGDESSYVQRRDGISLRDQILIGPPSHLLGIKGNSSFMIFMVLRLNRFAKPGEDHELLKLYGNTNQNMCFIDGLQLSFEPQAHEKDAQLISVKFRLQFGSDEALQEIVRLNISKPYMFIVKKEMKSLSLMMHDMSSDASSESSKVIISPKDVQNNNVLLSNKEMRINQTKNIDALLYAFGVYNEPLTDASNLHHHLFKELDKRTETFMNKYE